MRWTCYKVFSVNYYWEVVLIKKLVATAFVLIAVSGCASRNVGYEHWIFPDVGEIVSRSVGDSLITSGYGEVAPEIEIYQEYEFKYGILPKGKYPYYSDKGKETWFYKEEGEHYFYLNRENNLVCLNKSDCVKAEFAMGKAPVPGSSREHSFQQTLLYNGKIGNRVTIAYREFKNDFARPAFSNTVDYDMSESKIIGYKGARLEVIEATNTEIKYRIISGFVKK